MNYKIIQDEAAFKKFVDFLPILENNEKYYYSLFARKKYVPNSNIKADKGQLKSGVSTKERLFNKIKKLEVELGSYDVGGIEVPQESLALYITPNPRSMKKASIKTLKDLADNIGKDIYQNPQSVSLNAIQISKSRTVFVDFDFDVVNKSYDKYIIDIIYENTGNMDCFNIIKTRGGYHVLIDPSKTTNKKWYQNVINNKNVDQKGDLLLPVVGCAQGGFIPCFVK